MKRRRSRPDSLAGQLLLASPMLKDPNFARTVILLSAHDGEGALGVVLNRPLGRRLGELSESFAGGPLARVPLYRGGPVETEKLILAGWRRIGVAGDFELHFGLDPGRAEALSADPRATVRGYLGYAGWGGGQLEKEMGVHTWFVAPPADYNLETEDGVGLWRLILGSLDPEMKLLAEEPDDPSRN